MSNRSGGQQSPFPVPGWRAGLARGLRRIANRLVGQTTAASRLPVHAPIQPLTAQQERARSVLAEASAAMSSLIDEAPSPEPVEPEPPAVAHIPTEAVELRQALRSYTDRLERILARSEQEREELREHVRRLGEEVQSLRAEVAGLRVSLGAPEAKPALTAAAEDTVGTADVEPASPDGGLPPPDEVTGDGETSGDERADAAPEPAATDERTDAALERAATYEGHGGPTDEAETVVAAARAAGPAPMNVGEPLPASPEAEPEADDGRLARRLFPAGTVGLVLVLSPVKSFAGLTGIQSQLATEAGVEHVELQQYENGEARLQLNFRYAMEWPRLRAAVAGAAGIDAAELRCRLEGSTVRIRIVGPARDTPEQTS